MSEEKPFHDPQIRLSRIYTKSGDSGETSQVGGQRLAKDALRIECYGTIDELNSVIGLAMVSAAESAKLAALGQVLLRVQHELFNLGSYLATLPADVHAKQPRITDVEVEQLESDIDAMNDELEPLRSFTLPGGCRLNAELHLARTVCRRAERVLVALRRQEEVSDQSLRYLNRLSDALFVWSRWVNLTLGIGDVLWEPNRAASGGDR
jgi:cob(I)alamin adenosyltransferase